MECSVCLEDIKPEQEYCMLLCNHPFHPLCIQPWFTTKNSCPKCRMFPNKCQHASNSPIHLGIYLFEEIVLLKDKIKKLEEEQKNQTRSPAFSFRYDGHQDVNYDSDLESPPSHNNTPIVVNYQSPDEDVMVPFDRLQSMMNPSLNNIVTSPRHINIFNVLESMMRRSQDMTSSQLIVTPTTVLPSSVEVQRQPQAIFHHNHHIH